MKNTDQTAPLRTLRRKFERWAKAARHVQQHEIGTGKHCPKAEAYYRCAQACDEMIEVMLAGQRGPTREEGQRYFLDQEAKEQIHKGARRTGKSAAAFTNLSNCTPSTRQTQTHCHQPGYIQGHTQHRFP